MERAICLYTPLLTQPLQRSILDKRCRLFIQIKIVYLLYSRITQCTYVASVQSAVLQSTASFTSYDCHLALKELRIKERRNMTNLWLVHWVFCTTSMEWPRGNIIKPKVGSFCHLAAQDKDNASCCTKFGGANISRC